VGDKMLEAAARGDMAAVRRGVAQLEAERDATIRERLDAMERAATAAGQAELFWWGIGYAFLKLAPQGWQADDLEIGSYAPWVGHRLEAPRADRAVQQLVRWSVVRYARGPWLKGKKWPTIPLWPRRDPPSAWGRPPASLPAAFAYASWVLDGTEAQGGPSAMHHDYWEIRSRLKNLSKIS
jgi:hypothetical protein